MEEWLHMLRRLPRERKETKHSGINLKTCSPM